MDEVNDIFAREKACYEQNFQQFRSLNQMMWQVPIIAMTLTGGLWFGVSKVPSLWVQIAMLALAGIGNLGLTAVLNRIRYVMSQYLISLKSFHEPGYVSASGKDWCTNSERVAGTFKIMLLLSFLISAIGIVTLLVVRDPEFLSHCTSV